MTNNEMIDLGFKLDVTTDVWKRDEDRVSAEGAQAISRSELEAILAKKRAPQWGVVYFSPVDGLSRMALKAIDGERLWYAGVLPHVKIPPTLNVGTMTTDEWLAWAHGAKKTEFMSVGDGEPLIWSGL